LILSVVVMQDVCLSSYIMHQFTVYEIFTAVLFHDFSNPLPYHGFDVIH